MKSRPAPHSQALRFYKVDLQGSLRHPEPRTLPSVSPRRSFPFVQTVSVDRVIAPKGIPFGHHTSVGWFAMTEGGLCVLVRNDKKKTASHKRSGFYLCWHYLSSRQVTLQVLSAQTSLTSVFGMGTGGPSSQSIPTYVVALRHFMSKSFLCDLFVFHIP